MSFFPRLRLRKNSGATVTEPRINFVEGDGIGIVLVDDPGAEEVIVTIESTGGSGDVATDALWDAKGDLAVASGADAADNLAVGSNGQVLVAASGETLGVEWADPSTLSSVSYHAKPAEKPPASPHAKDDEFNDASLDSKWTKYNFSTASDVEKAYGHYEVTGIASDNFDNFRGLHQAAPSGDFTITTKVGTVGMLAHAGCGIGLWQGTGSSDDKLGFGIVHNGFNNPPSYKAWKDVYASDTGGRTGGELQQVSPAAPYLRFRRVSTTWYFDSSDDGLHWDQVTTTAEAWTITNIGLWFATLTTATPLFWWEWFRVDWVPDFTP